MPRSILILIITIFTSVAFAQENAPNGGTLRGEVFDTTAEPNPIEGVTVNIVGIDKKVVTVKTDAKGQYKFDNLPAGRYVINIYKRGYHSKFVHDVTIINGGDDFVQIKMSKDDTKKFVTEGFLHVAESIGERYKLEKPSMEALYQSLLEVLIGLELRNLVGKLQKGGLVGAMALLLSDPDSKAVFAKYLTETQLHDYIEFIENRQQQVWQTTARFLTVVLDQTLSLTPKQREDVLKLLLDTTADLLELSPASMFSVPDLQHKVADFLHYELNISLETILTPTQAKIWNGLINLKNAEGDLVGATGPLPESELIDALLTAHTEQQLGTLSEREKQRLRVAIKGIIQQAIETQPDIKEKINYIDASDELANMFIKQSLPRQQATEQLEILKKALADETGIGKRWVQPELHNLTSHPLYQQTIKEVLSEKAYRQYTERQTERQVFQTQASQELFVTSLDAALLLKETHRKQLETTTAQVPLLSLNSDGLHMMATEILLRDPELVNLLRRYNVDFAEENMLKVPNGGTLHGTAVDTTPEQNPIEGVEVKIADTNNKVVTIKTDAEGHYQFDRLPAGLYLMSTSKKGYVDRVNRPVIIIDNGEHFKQIIMSRTGDAGRDNIIRTIERPLEHVTGAIGERYKLEKPSVEALREALLEVLTVLETRNLEAKLQGGMLAIIALLLSETDSKAALAKHLTETQLHDYIEFIENRKRQATQTVARFLTAFLDETLSLNHEQREDVLKLLLDTIIAHSQELPVTYMFSSYNLQHEVVDWIQDELKISLQTILTPTQTKIWNGLINLRNAKRDKVVPDDTEESSRESQLPQLIETALTAHTEQQLETLSEPENRRLRVAIKGVIQQAIEERKLDNIEEKINYIDASSELA